MDPDTTEHNSDGENLELFCGNLLSKDDKEKRSKFVELLARLDGAILPDGTSRAVNKELQMVQEQLRISKMRFLQNDILFRTAKNMCLDSSSPLEATADSDITNFTKICDSVNEAIIDGEVEQMLGCLTVDELGEHKHDGNIMNLKSFKRKTLNAVESYSLRRQVSERIRTRVINLRKYYEQLLDPVQACRTDISRDLWLSKAGHLSSVVQCKKQELAQVKALIRTSEEHQFKSVQDYHKVMLKVLYGLWRLGKTIASYNADFIDAKELTVEVDAILGKLKVLQFKILVDLYSVGVLAAHRNIRGHLEMALDKTMSERHRVQSVLATYEAQSSEFTGIAAEHAQVLKQIQEERWMLDKILADHKN